MTKKKLLKLWKELNNLNDLDDVEYGYQLLSIIEDNLPFKDDQEHEKWIDLACTYKFFEDFEKLTLSIASRL